VLLFASGERKKSLGAWLQEKLYCPDFLESTWIPQHLVDKPVPTQQFGL
jgi:hypothetical protein